MPPAFQLTMKTGPQPGKIYPLTKGEMIVGRDATADVVIPDAEVSRKHARLYLQGGGYVLEDLGSTNGSFVEGQRLMGPHALKAGESVMFGENIGLVFDMINTDPEATIVGAPAMMDMPPKPVEPTPQPVYSAPNPEPAAMPSYSVPTPDPAPQPVYNAPMSSTPADIGSPVTPAPAKKNNTTRNWVLASCGCLLILLCACAAIGYYVYSTGMLNSYIK